MYFVCEIYHQSFFFFNDTATTEIYTLSLHDALPICPRLAREEEKRCCSDIWRQLQSPRSCTRRPHARKARSEEHTSELQSRQYLVCRLLLEKKTKRMR